MTPPAAATAAARHRAAAAPARPARRVSGPAPAPRRQAPPRRRPTAVPRPSRRDLPLGARVLEWLRGLPDHRLLDRLIGGRVWIVLIGTLLVGIVTLQLSLLKLNAGIGRAVERSTALQQANTSLEAEVSRLSDPQRIVAQATARGFVIPPQGSPRFVAANPGDARAALGVIRVPSPSALATLTAATATATTATGTAATGTSAAATTPAATTAAPGATTAAPGTTTASQPPATTGAGATATGTTGATGATPAPSVTQTATPSTPAAAGGAAPPVGPQG